MENRCSFVVYGTNPDGKPLASGKFSADAALKTFRGYIAMGATKVSVVQQYDGGARDISEAELEKLASAEH